jgi:uncharacterized protein with von Willebrand factor type A (vWA) domain
MADKLTPVLTGFAASLRAAGLPVGTGEVLAQVEALTLLDPADLDDMYWSGRITLVHRHHHLRIYDDVFRQFFLGAGGRAAPAPLAVPAPTAVAGSAVIPATDPERRSPSTDSPASLGLSASAMEVLRSKSFAACTPDELSALRAITVIPPVRRTRRYARAPSGTRLDVRRLLRESLRTGGEPGSLRWRRRRVRPRPLVFLLDISGSMADYSRALLQFAWRMPAGTEVFCFGTRLTRVSAALARRGVDDAISSAARTAFDWDAGTRIGGSLASFVRLWARRGLCRRGIVVICSDGLDRGSPAELAASIADLRRLCFRIVWVSPHLPGAGRPASPAGRPAGAPAGALPGSTGELPVGLTAALPSIDLLTGGASLRDLERLAALLADLR